MSLDSVHKGEMRPFAELEGKFEEIAAKAGKLMDAATEKRLKRFLRLLATGDKTKFKRAADRLEVDLLKIADKHFGPESAYSREARRHFAQAAKLGRLRLAKSVAEATGKQAVLKATSRDVASMMRAATDHYDLAAKNLGADGVMELRKLVTQEILQGSGEDALRAKLMKSGHIEDLSLPTRTLKAETRARMMARTEPRRITEATYREATQEVEPDEAKRLYKWISVLGLNSGEDSLARHGLVMSEDEWNTHNFGDGFQGFPPLRPNDQCSVIFMREVWLDAQQKQAMKAKPGTDERRVVQKAEESERQKLLGA